MRQPDDYTEDEAAYYAYQQEIEKLEAENKRLRAIIDNGLGPEDLHQDSMQSHIN